jgi:hypothetical protein
MTAIYIMLALAVGFLLGVFATALAVISGDKNKRGDER